MLPASFTPTNDIAEALLAQLVLELPPLLAAEKLPAVKEFLNYDPFPPQPAKAPQCWVDVAQDEVSEEKSRGATLHKYSHLPQILVGITAAGNEPEHAVRHLRKTADLIVRAAGMERHLGGLVLWVKWRGTDYSPNMGTAGSLFKMALLTFEVNHRSMRIPVDR